MKKKRRKRSWGDPLSRLVDFLNWDAEAEFKQTTFRDEFRDDVQKLLDPPPIPPEDLEDLTVAKTPAQYWLWNVLKKIEASMDHEDNYSWNYYPPVLLWRNSPTVRIGKERFVVEHGPIPQGRGMTYYELGETLRSGEFSKLRRCQSEKCKKYFATNRSKKQCCSRECSWDYQNRTRLNKGYWNKRRRKFKTGELKKRRARRALTRRHVLAKAPR